jgi:regulator of replication initiation timing
MMANDESMGSLEELSDNLHQHLSTHIDHASVLQYELDMLRSQLSEKNRLVRVFFHKVLLN